MATKQESREVRFNEVFALRMPAELVARLEAAAERQYETASSLTRRFILEGLTRSESREVGAR